MEKKDIKILAIDDEESFREAYSEMFEDYDIRVVKNKQEAINQITVSKDFNFIFLNINLHPKIYYDGVQVLQTIKDKGLSARVFVITGSDTFGSSLTPGHLFQKFGVNDLFLKNPKGFDYIKFIDIIENYRKSLGVITQDSTYRKAVFGINLSGNSFTGTGCLCQYNDSMYIVTCAHVLSDINDSIYEGSEVDIFPFIQECENVYKSNVIYYKPPATQRNRWKAKQDIALLSLPHELKKLLQPLSFNSELQNLEKIQNCCFFGFGTNNDIGREILNIDIDSLYRKGFYKINLPTNQDSIQDGDSGSPLFHINNGLLGIIQARHGQKAGYIIPFHDIIKIIEEL
ncbi:response regulator [bacterium]|nr:MAG: response regulator [bacterium]